jgi:hypothetical protein
MTLTTDKGPLSSHNGSIFPDIWKSVAVEHEKIRAERDAKLKREARAEVSAANRRPGNP